MACECAVHEERYSIDLAAQKEMLYIEDAEAMTVLRLAEQIERSARSLDEISRTLRSPDRSLLMSFPIDRHLLSGEQKALLAELLELGARANSKLFFAAQYMGKEHATIRAARSSKTHREEKEREVDAFVEDIEF